MIITVLLFFAVVSNTKSAWPPSRPLVRCFRSEPGVNRPLLPLTSRGTSRLELRARATIRSCRLSCIFTLPLACLGSKPFLQLKRCSLNRNRVINLELTPTGPRGGVACVLRRICSSSRGAPFRGQQSFDRLHRTPPVSTQLLASLVCVRHKLFIKQLVFFAAGAGVDGAMGLVLSNSFVINHLEAFLCRNGEPCAR